jgi:hypothetical protein
LEQVELEALPPDVLEGSYRDALAQFWDEAAYQAVLGREQTDRERL